MTDVDPTGAVLVETDGAGVRTLTFNRPERRNGWSSDLEDAYYFLSVITVQATVSNIFTSLMPAD